MQDFDHDDGWLCTFTLLQKLFLSVFCCQGKNIIDLAQKHLLQQVIFQTKKDKFLDNKNIN
jgi:hypothetical protein